MRQESTFFPLKEAKTSVPGDFRAQLKPGFLWFEGRISEHRIESIEHRLLEAEV